jgi:hypothetical protein
MQLDDLQTTVVKSVGIKLQEIARNATTGENTCPSAITVLVKTERQKRRRN